MSGPPYAAAQNYHGRVSDSHIFGEYVRESHVVPQDVATWRKLNVVAVQNIDNGNVFKLDMLVFKDGSVYHV